ncbi:MAG TPA: F0F1 ATP synthase subunit A [Chthoniobacteraceae bacterium]|nr:F0F1 ATP synthase subunit A [Chthoniobacteraceae bacterium]
MIASRAGSGWLAGLLAIVLIFCGGGATSLFAQEAVPTPTPIPVVEQGTPHAEEEHGLTQHAPVIYDGKYFKINNSMIASWVVAALLILGARLATRNIKEVPEGAQNFWEWMVESLYNFLEGLVGSELVKKTFWFFATIFIFILFTNWAGLIPGVGTLGFGTTDAEGHFHLTRPFLRGANADMNMTMAMAMLFFLFWTIWALQANGIQGFILHLFGPKGDTTGLLKVLMVVVFIGVGFLEVVTIAFRPITLSFRLFGNVFAGENMLETMAHMGGTWFGWLLPIPFYFLELLVGLVQALVFMLLTAVFTLLICEHDEEHASH